MSTLSQFYVTKSGLLINIGDIAYMADRANLNGDYLIKFRLTRSRHGDTSASSELFVSAETREELLQFFRERSFTSVDL